MNARIRENAEVATRLMTPEQPRSQIGAMALFGEKYGEEVRVVAHGPRPDATEKHGVYSLELCGGTHVRRTGDIGLFRIVSEGAVSAGVRRVEAVTGEAALKVIEERDRQLNEAAAALKVPPAELAERIAALVEERRKLERDVAELRKKLATGGAAAEVETIGGLRVALRNVGEVPARDLKGACRGDPEGRHGRHRRAGLDRRAARPASSPGWAKARRAGRMRSRWCVRRRPRSAARAAAGGRRWRRPAARMPRRRPRRWPRCARR